MSVLVGVVHYWHCVCVCASLHSRLWNCTGSFEFGGRRNYNIKEVGNFSDEIEFGGGLQF